MTAAGRMSMQMSQPWLMELRAAALAKSASRKPRQP